MTLSLTRKPNRWQRKDLTSGNISSDGVIADLSFNNLVIGNTYRITFCGSLTTNNGTADLTARVEIQHDGNTIVQLHRTDTEVASSLDIMRAGVSTIFIATATTLSFVGASLSANSSLESGTDGRTFSLLEELHDYTETTDFT